MASKYDIRIEWGDRCSTTITEKNKKGGSLFIGDFDQMCSTKCDIKNDIKNIWSAIVKVLKYEKLKKI
jgi:hypothetical protein